MMQAAEESYDYRAALRGSSTNYYEVLGVEKEAPSREIKKEYYKLSMKWHPDKNPDCPECEKKFSKIAKAYVLPMCLDLSCMFSKLSGQVQGAV